MQNSIVYPASITCEIVPEFEDAEDRVSDFDYSHSSFNLLSREDEDEIDYEEIT